MRDETLPRSSTTEFDYGRAVAKEESRWTLKALRINRYLNRPLASLLVRTLYRTSITPNQVTITGFVVGAAGAGFFLVGTRGAIAVGGALAQLSSIIDCADGMLARARGQESEFGAGLDLILDRIGEFFLLSAATAGLYMRSGRVLWLGLGLLAIAIYFLELSLFYLIKSVRRDLRRADAAENRAWLMALIAVFGIAGRVDLGIYVLLGASTAIVIFHLAEYLINGTSQRA
ncbi:MAG: CDP-alcohol phosphatidyltransferase family protein [Acidobacteriota bacterium]|nr:CDP-alcohol phosphatidyltransferase family protein [Acidobacteriota bacterium]